MGGCVHVCVCVENLAQTQVCYVAYIVAMQHVNKITS